MIQLTCDGRLTERQPVFQGLSGVKIQDANTWISIPEILAFTAVDHVGTRRDEEGIPFLKAH